MVSGGRVLPKLYGPALSRTDKAQRNTEHYIWLQELSQSCQCLQQPAFEAPLLSFLCGYTSVVFSVFEYDRKAINF